MYDWPKWKEAIQTVRNSLTKQEVFGLIVQMLEDVKLIRHKWVCVCVCVCVFIYEKAMRKIKS